MLTQALGQSGVLVALYCSSLVCSSVYDVM